MKKEYLTYIVGGALSVLLGVGLWFGGQALNQGDFNLFEGNVAANPNSAPQQNVPQNNQQPAGGAGSQQQSEVDLDRMGTHISGSTWENINGDLAELTLNRDRTFTQGNERGSWELAMEEAPDGTATVVFMRFDGNKNGEREFAVFEVTTNTFTIGDQNGNQVVYERVVQ